MTRAYTRKPTASTRSRILAALLALVTIVLGILDAMVLNSMVIHPLAYTYTKPLTWTLWSDTAIVVFVLAWLILVYASAYGYQRAVERNRLRPLFARVTLIQIAVPVLLIAATRLILLLVPPPVW